MALFEQLRVKCFGRRPGLPRAQKSGGSRRLRRCRSWDHGSPCGGADPALSPLPIASPLQPSPLPATPCSLSVSELSPSSFGGVFSPTPPPPSFGTARSMSAGFTAAGFADAASSFQTPPRGLSRTYSEDEEVDLSAGSVSSVSSVDSECGREFMDVLQVCPDTAPCVALALSHWIVAKHLLLRL